MKNSSRNSYDMGAGCSFKQTSADNDDTARIERLAGIDWANGVCCPREHRLDSIQTAIYRIEWRRLSGRKTFSYQ